MKQIICLLLILSIGLNQGWAETNEVVLPAQFVRELYRVIATCDSNYRYSQMENDVWQWRAGEWKKRALQSESWLEKNDGKISFLVGVLVTLAVVKIVIQIK